MNTLNTNHTEVGNKPKKRGRPVKYQDEQMLSLIQSIQEEEGMDIKDLGGYILQRAINSILQAEISSFLSSYPHACRNGYSSKKVKSNQGMLDINTPRDRENEFEPRVIPKHQREINRDIESKIISLYAYGMSYSDISNHIRELYGLDVSTSLINTITDKILEEVHHWRNRTLEEIYPFVFLDAIHYKVKVNTKFEQKAVYTLLGINLRGRKEILGFYLLESEGSAYWSNVLADLKNRGVKDIFLACIDGLKGFPEAIKAVYPNAEIQQCVVHRIRNTLNFISHKNKEEFATDLKEVYQASNAQSAYYALEQLQEKWGNKYPLALRGWFKNWEYLSAYFKFPKEIRKIIYTTNAIEAVHKQFRKLTKTKGGFSSEDALSKIIYLSIKNVSRKWKMAIANWSYTLGVLSVYYENRFNEEDCEKIRND